MPDGPQPNLQTKRLCACTADCHYSVSVCAPELSTTVNFSTHDVAEIFRPFICSKHFYVRKRVAYRALVECQRKRPIVRCERIAAISCRFDNRARAGVHCICRNVRQLNHFKPVYRIYRSRQTCHNFNAVSVVCHITQKLPELIRVKKQIPVCGREFLLVKNLSRCPNVCTNHML